MAALSPGLMVSIAVLIVALGSDLWVLSDARRRLERGERVTVAIGNLRVETPEAWFLGTLLLWVIFLPLYLTATGRNPFAHRSS